MARAPYQLTVTLGAGAVSGMWHNPRGSSCGGIWHLTGPSQWGQNCGRSGWTPEDRHLCFSLLTFHISHQISATTATVLKSHNQCEYTQMVKNWAFEIEAVRQEIWWALILPKPKLILAQRLLSCLSWKNCSNSCNFSFFIYKWDKKKCLLYAIKD